MADPVQTNAAKLSPGAAISLALALGAVCTIAGIAMTGYVIGKIDGSRWLQFAWLLVLFFGAPGGFVVLSEFTPGAYRSLKVVQRFNHVSKWVYRSVGVTGGLGLVITPTSMAFVAKLLFMLPGPALIGFALLERFALKTLEHI